MVVGPAKCTGTLRPNTHTMSIVAERRRHTPSLPCMLAGLGRTYLRPNTHTLSIVAERRERFSPLQPFASLQYCTIYNT